jgi:nucleoside-diphosphate-sugar epimerase
MTQTIALTGATGFIGSVLARQMASAGWQVRALVRPASIHKRSIDIGTQWITGNLHDMESLRRLVAGADAVVHCAGAVRGIDRKDFDRTNVDGVARLAHAAAGQDPKPRFVLISSLAAREPHLSDYAASKKQGEKALAEAAGDMPRVIFRPPAVYGPGDREMLPLFKWMTRGIAPIVGSDRSRISLVYVTDLAEAIIHCLKYGTCQGGTYEVHDGHVKGYSWHDIIDAVARLTGVPIKRAKIPVSVLNMVATLNLGAARILGYPPMLTPGKVRELTHPDWVCDDAPLRRDTDWIANVQLARGLRQTLRLS